MDWTELESLVGRSSLLNQSADPRIGSSLENSTGGTLSHSTSSDSSSASSLGSTFIPVLIFLAVCIIIFLIFRRTCPRVYAPRTLRGIRNEDELSPTLPNGWFNWIMPFWRISDEFILNHCSLDGFFFLRFLRVLAIISFAGCFLVWPVLLVINGTGNNGQVQLDILTIGNVAYPIRFYAHALVGCLFFGFVLFMICRECVYYINMRQAYLMSPLQSQRLSSRTVLFTCVPKRFLDERRIRKLYGDSVKNVWIPTNTTLLERLVKERDSTAERLEKAEIQLIKKANAAYRKMHGVPELPTSSFGRLAWPLAERKARKAAKKAAAKTTATSDTPATAASTSTTPPTPPLAPPASPRASPPASPFLPSLPELPSSPLSGTTAANTHVSLSPTQSNASRLSTTSEEVHREVVSIDRHGSVSDTASTPSATDTFFGTLTIPSPNLFETAFLDNPDEANDAREEEENDEEVQTERQVAEEDDDKENEQDYKHPYGYAPNLPDALFSVATQFIPYVKLPTHRPLANFGKKVNTIRWSRDRIKDLNKAIAQTRRRFRNGHGDTLSAVFVEFDTQAAAQVAFQVLAHHLPLHMSPRFIGIRPDDVIWSSLRIKWWERIIRRFAMMAFIAVSVIFWSLPCAVVGIVSNISFLASTFSFLSWIEKLPSAITGVIEGLLPSLALSMLMSIVPAMMRQCARTAGVTSIPMVELYSQSAYMIFQVVQVFLVTTLTSAASASLGQILEDPLSVKDLLSQNLPKASNFYLSYITVQCLAGGALGLVHVLDLFRHSILAKTMEDPRRAYRTYHRLKQPHWGGLFPVYTNMGIIAISYACIAPLILVFASIGMIFAYYVYRYNLLYFYDVDVDTKGLHYPRALMHLMTGLYMAELCLVGLFSLQSAIGPLVVMAMFMVFTFLVNLSLNDAVKPLLSSLPRTVALKDADLAGPDDVDDEPAAPNGPRAEDNDAGLAADYYNMEEPFGEGDPNDNLHDGPVSTRGLGMGLSLSVDGASGLLHIFTDYLRSTAKESLKAGTKAIKEDTRSSRFGRFVPWFGSPEDPQGEEREGGAETTPDKKKVNFFVRWLHPEVYEDFSFLSKMLPAEPAELQYPEDYVRRSYWPPEMWKPVPHLWLPRDDARVSRQEVAFAREYIHVTDRGAWLTPRGHVMADVTKAPFHEPRIMY